MVADTGGPTPPGIDVYDVDGPRLKSRRRFCSMELKAKFGSSDGIRADTEGNIWSAAGWVGDGYDGVHIFAPNWPADWDDSSCRKYARTLVLAERSAIACSWRPANRFTRCTSRPQGAHIT